MGRPKLDINRDIQCKTCKIVKPADGFYLVKSNGYTVRLTRCIECERAKQLAAYHDKPRDDKYLASRKRTCKNHGITVERYDEMVAEQNGVCPICLSRPHRFYIDHDHGCCPGAHGCAKCVRGLLCRNCNSALGLISDSRDAANRAVIYLSER